MRCIDGDLNKESIRLIEGSTFLVKLICGDVDNSTICFDEEILTDSNWLVPVSIFSGELDCGGVDDNTS